LTTLSDHDQARQRFKEAAFTKPVFIVVGRVVSPLAIAIIAGIRIGGRQLAQKLLIEH
jgi:hypothetical protein